MRKNVKALSPIFSTLVILAIVAVLFIPVFIWSANLTGETKGFWELSGLIATERIVVEEVSLKAGSLSCTIYVRNIGKTAVTVDGVLISESDGSVHTYTGNMFTASPNSVVQGNLITINIANLGFTPVANDVYTVKVFTSRGVSDTYQAVA